MLTIQVRFMGFKFSGYTRKEEWLTLCFPSYRNILHAQRSKLHSLNMGVKIFIKVMSRKKAGSSFASEEGRQRVERNLLRASSSGSVCAVTLYFLVVYFLVPASRGKFQFTWVLVDRFNDKTILGLHTAT